MTSNFSRLLLREMNREVDDNAEDRKGGATNLAKMLLSASTKQLAIVVNVPACVKDVSAKEWLTEVGKGLDVVIASETPTVITATVAADPDNEKFPLKMRDQIVNVGFDFLNKKGLVPTEDSDDDFDISAAYEDNGIEW